MEANEEAEAENKDKRKMWPEVGEQGGICVFTCFIFGRQFYMFCAYQQQQDAFVLSNTFYHI